MTHRKIERLSLAEFIRIEIFSALLISRFFSAVIDQELPALFSFIGEFPDFVQSLIVPQHKLRSRLECSYGFYELSLHSGEMKSHQS
jgi:hypothetical protein